ncbi:MAG TPA: lysozyme inhibitor LprI family protein [Oleiagrimonas sp.]|nr:lysozyme inhibitor LprI family protein [Oleiagrimonas sp.]
MRVLTAGQYASGALLLSLALGFSANAAAKGHWDWSQEVRYVGNHDPHRVWLDGTKDKNIEVIFGAIPWDELNAWPKGKQLLLAYSGKTGTVLVDPDSGKWDAVVGGIKHQPIDLLAEACFKRAKTTRDTESCYVQQQSRWGAEMKLWYRRFMAMKGMNVSDAAKQSLKKAQQQWEAFHDAQSDALGELYGPRQGTIWPTVELKKEVELLKARALELASYCRVL